MLIEITEELFIDVVQPPRNPIFVVWLNANNGLSYWCFGINTVNGKKVESLGTKEDFILDLQTTLRRSADIGKKTINQIVATYEHVAKSKAEWISKITDSPSVWLYKGIRTLNGIDEILWQQIKVGTGSFQVSESDFNTSKLTITIDLPEQFNQSY